MSKSNKEDGFRSGSKNWPKKLFWVDVSGKVKHQANAFRVGAFRFV
jgi:hypothetical protein